MRVRCWVALGSSVTMLPQGVNRGVCYNALPHAADFNPGDWVTWIPSAGSYGVVMVCVEIPVIA